MSSGEPALIFRFLKDNETGTFEITSGALFGMETS